jgi:hypothetical protein
MREAVKKRVTLRLIRMQRTNHRLIRSVKKFIVKARYEGINTSKNLRSKTKIAHRLVERGATPSPMPHACYDDLTPKHFVVQNVGQPPYDQPPDLRPRNFATEQRVLLQRVGSGSYACCDAACRSRPIPRNILEYLFELSESGKREANLYYL